MKKFLFIIITVTSFIPFAINKKDYKDITKIIYVSSIGIDYDLETKEYNLHFYILNYLNLTNAKISSSNIDDLAYTMKTSSTDFYKAFTDIESLTNVNVSMSHLKTVILTNNFINKNNLLKFYNLIRANQKIYPNFYLFTTSSKLDDIFNIKNFSDVSAYHTLLVSPTTIYQKQLISFNVFTNIILFDNYTILIPNLKLNKDILSKQDQNFYTLKVNGCSYLDSTFKLITYTSDEFLYQRWLFKLEDIYFKIKDYDIYLKSGKYNVKFKNNKYIIKYKLSAVLTLNPYNEKVIDIEKKLAECIKKEIYLMLLKLYDKEIDAYNLKYKYKLLKINIEDIQIEVKLGLN